MTDISPAKKKKILYVITKSNWGGAQRYVFDLATNFPPDLYEVAVVLGGNGLLKTRLKAAGIRTISIETFGRDISISRDVGSFGRIYTIIKNERPDIIHLNSPKAAGLGALAGRLLGVKKIITTIHGWSFNENRNILWKSAVWLLSWITALLSTDIIVIANRELKTARHMPFIKHKTHLIYNGVAPISFVPGNDARLEILGPDNFKHWIGTIAELTQNKGQTYLIESAYLLKKNGFTFRMPLIGDGEDQPKIQRLAEKRGLYNSPGSSAYISFILPSDTETVDFKHNAASNLKAFDIFVLASVKEGLPYVLLEAGLAGLPVVATNVGGIPEIIEDEKTGLLVPPKNPAALAEAIERLIKNPDLAHRLGSTLEKSVREKFTLSNMFGKTKKIYEE